MSDIVGELLKSIDGNVPVATAKLIDRAADEIAALRSALSDARAEARREALEDAATVAATCQPKSALLRQGIAFAIRALMQQEKQG